LPWETIASPTECGRFIAPHARSDAASADTPKDTCRHRRVEAEFANFATSLIRRRGSPVFRWLAGARFRVSGSREGEVCEGAGAVRRSFGFRKGFTHKPQRGRKVCRRTGENFASGRINNSLAGGRAIGSNPPSHLVDHGSISARQAA
jgi:hypothetical protein